MDGYTVVEVWVIVDADGNSVLGESAEQAAERYTDDYTDEGQARRVIRATINVPTPKHVELVATVPGEVPCGELVVA